MAFSGPGQPRWLIRVLALTSNSHSIEIYHSGYAALQTVQRLEVCNAVSPTMHAV